VINVVFGKAFAGMFTSNREVAALAGTLVTIAGVYRYFGCDPIGEISARCAGCSTTGFPSSPNAVCYWVLCLPTVYF